MVNVLTSLNNLKTNVDDLDFGKLNTVPVDLKRLIYVVDNEVVKNIKFNTLKMRLNKVDKKIPDATTLLCINQYKRINKIWKKIGDVDKKIPGASGLVTTLFLIQKLKKFITKYLNLLV